MSATIMMHPGSDHRKEKTDPAYRRPYEVEFQRHEYPERPEMPDGHAYTVTIGAMPSIPKSSPNAGGFCSPEITVYINFDRLEHLNAIGQAIVQQCAEWRQMLAPLSAREASNA